MGETEICPAGSKICIATNEGSKATSTSESETENEAGSSPVLTCQCKECGKKFSKASKLRTHMFLHTGERPYVCSHSGCNKAYTSSSHLLRHMNTHKKYDDGTMHVCQVCMGIFRTSGGLRKHVKVVHEAVVKNYPCKECGEAFRKKILLTQHMQKHGGNPAYKCKICTLTFPLKRQFNRHLRGHKKHPCKVPGCNEVLANWSLFRKHMAVHNMSQEKKCSVCGEQFQNRHTFYDHMEIHREGGEIVCPYSPCEKTYRHKRNLNQHILSHHIGVRFACCHEGCCSKFISKQKLVWHIKHVHGGDGGPPPKDNGDCPKVRAPRKDKGTRKRAMAPRLAGLLVPYEEEKRLLMKEEKDEDADIQSPESGLFSLSGTTTGSAAEAEAMESSEGNDPQEVESCKKEKAENGEPTDASELQGPSETQRRNEDPHETSSDESFMYSGGESSDEDSGSGHCDDDDDDDGDDGGDDDHDDEGGDDDDDDDFHEDDDDEGDDDEGEEGNGVEEEGDDGREDANQLAQGDGSNGKRAGSESLSRDEIPDGASEFGVDRDGTVPTGDADEIGSPDSGENDRTSPLSTEEVQDDSVSFDDKHDGGHVRDQNQRGSKRRSDEGDYEVSRKKRKDEYALSTETVDNGSPDMAPCEDESFVSCELPVNIKHLDRNVDPKIFEVSLSKEKASKQLPKEVWIATFQKSVENCLPVKSEMDDHPVKREAYS